MKKKKKQQPTVFYLVWRSEKITWNWRRSKVTKKKVAEMSRQRQTEELVSKRKTTLELKKNPFFLPSLL